MNSYVDISIRPDPEFCTATLFNLLFGRFHMGLVMKKLDCVGVSFPEATQKPRSMGNIMRLHGEVAPLADLMEIRWWKPVNDYIKIDGPRNVPTERRYCEVRRVQAKTNPDRLRRRLARRHNISLEEAKRRIPDSAAKKLEYPFLELKSASTSRRFKLFVRQEIVQDASIGKFNFYGFSSVATVPWF
jgi:CRISPR-associated endonuclease Csy4